jgi:hypothetical protein
MEHPAFFDWSSAATSQFPVVTEPANWVVSSPIWQPGPVWRVMPLFVWSFTPSIMSISPFFGQLGPVVQKLRYVSDVTLHQVKSTYAGHVPQPKGMWATSTTISPLSYVFLLSIRILGLPSGVWFCVSTPHEMAEVDELMRFVCLAVASLTYCTKPSVGSGPVKKSKAP